MNSIHYKSKVDEKLVLVIIVWSMGNPVLDSRQLLDLLSES